MEVKLLAMVKILLVTALFTVIMLPVGALAESEGGSASGPGGTVTSAEELNRALGGIHAVSGNRVILQKNVTLDRGIDIEADRPLILDLNKKTIVYDKEGTGTVDSPSWTFSLKSDLTIDGHGTIETTKNNVAAIWMMRCTLTINSGVIKTQGKDSPAIFAFSYNKHLSKITINGGMLQSKTSAVVSWEGAVVDMQVNGGEIKGAILLERPYAYDGNEEVYSGENILNVTGGKVKRIQCMSTKYSMSSGTILEGLVSRASKVNVSGGIISGQGLDIEGGKFVMSGGTISASDRSGLRVSAVLGSKKGSCTASILGGTITTTQKGARGIAVNGDEDRSYGYVELKIGGKAIIRSAAKDSTSAGVYAASKYAQITLQSTKGKAAYIKGYKYGVYKKGPATISVGKSTKVYTPRASKLSYVAGQKLSKSVKGDMSIKYVN